MSTVRKLFSLLFLVIPIVDFVVLTQGLSMRHPVSNLSATRWPVMYLAGSENSNAFAESFRCLVYAI